MEIESLNWLEVISKNEETAICVVPKGTTGYTFKEPILIEIPLKMDRITQAVYTYVYEGLSWRMPKLMQFVFQNKTLLNLADYLYRHKTRSTGTLWVYIYEIKRYCDYLGKNPGQLISECFTAEGSPDSKTLYQHAKQLDNYLTELQLDGLASSTINNFHKAINALYTTNKLNLNYPYKIPIKTMNRDRAPTPEELQTLMDLGDPRDRVVVSCLALGGFREETLCKLKLYHIQEDLERGVTPVHVHVEAEITKGKYCDYDTFLGREAVEAIKAYITKREQGSPKGFIPSEELNPDSPLIRADKNVKVKPVRPHQIYNVVHGLYHKAGLLKDKRGKFYNLRPHSIRKYFRTQLASLGVPGDYIEYMMGHKVSTYHDIQMKGVEFMRNVYVVSGFGIKPRTRMEQEEYLANIILSLNVDRKEIIRRLSLVEPHRTEITPQQGEELRITELRKILKEALKREVLTEEGSEGIKSAVESNK